MKKIILFGLMIMMVAAVYAVTSVGIYNSADQGDSGFQDGDGAKIPVSLILEGVGAPESVKVGFVSGDVSAIDTDTSSMKVESASLTPVTGAAVGDHAVGTAYLDRGKTPVNVFWQIQSPNTLYVKLSTSALSNGAPSGAVTIDWEVSGTGDDEFTIGGTGEDVSYDTALVHTHKGSGTSYTSFGDADLEMKTASYVGKIGDTYSADLTVTVSTTN